MTGKILLSTAYLPPSEYFSLILNGEGILIEKEENYLKQTYRNRCYLLSANGIHSVSVPVFLGSIHKTPIKETRIDYSKRWQQVHLGAINAAYRASPFFEFYYEDIEKIIMKSHEFLIDLNMELLLAILKILGSEKIVSCTTQFEASGTTDNDFRYCLKPKIPSDFRTRGYTQVFINNAGSDPRLSILDLVFNMGPESAKYLQTGCREG